MMMMALWRRVQKSMETLSSSSSSSCSIWEAGRERIEWKRANQKKREREYKKERKKERRKPDSRRRLAWFEQSPNSRTTADHVITLLLCVCVWMMMMIGAIEPVSHEWGLVSGWIIVLISVACFAVVGGGVEMQCDKKLLPFSSLALLSLCVCVWRVPVWDDCIWFDAC